MKKIVIGARASNLALIQAQIIKGELLANNPNLDIEIVGLSTKGDQRQDINWKTSTESLKGLFTSELEVALLENEIDIAVHSLKDMPSIIHHDLEIAAYVNQEDERDVLVSAKYNSLEDLPSGAIIGTSSLRREAQLLLIRPDLNTQVIRGNIETRINKMLSGEYDAIILAAAGLHRTNNKKYIKHYFNDEQMLSASGQGMLCLETRKDDTYIKDLIQPLKNENTTYKALVERTFSKIFDGGCTTPMGCNAIVENDRIFVKGLYFYQGKPYYGYVEGYTYESEALAYKLSNQIKKQYADVGKVYLIGSGPGDADLLTLKAYKLLQKADCVLYDRLISEDVLAMIDDQAKLVYVGKGAHEGGLSQALINQQIVDAALEHQLVVRLKSGDPFIFGRGFEEIQAIQKYDIDFEIVPGVSSFIGASAYSGIPLTDRMNADSIHIFTGHNKTKTTNLNYAEVAKLNGTLIFFMAIRQLKEIFNDLMAAGYNPNQKVAIIENATTSDQRVIISNAEQIVHSDITDKIKAPAIIMAGEVVNLYEKATWFNKNKKPIVLSTRQSKYFDSFNKTAKAYGFEALSSPMIDISEYQDSKKNINDYEVILFNSVNGVRYFLKQYGSECLTNKKVGAVGSKTLELLNQHGIDVALLPKVFNMDQLVEETIKKYPCHKMLVINSLITQFDLKKWQRRIDNEICGSIDQLITYQTTKTTIDLDIFEEQIKTANVITFFSASAVESFLEKIDYQLAMLDSKKIASIGPFTTKALVQAGLKVDIEADVSTQDGLLEKIKEYYDV